MTTNEATVNEINSEFDESCNSRCINLDAPATVSCKETLILSISDVRKPFETKNDSITSDNASSSSVVNSEIDGIPLKSRRILNWFISLLRSLKGLLVGTSLGTLLGDI